MAILKRKMRGLKHIRTLSGRLDPASMSYKVYMKLSCLEQEKLRLANEREKIEYRVKDIEARAQEIEAERAALLQALGGQIGDHPVDTADDKPTPAPRSRTGIKLRY